MEFTAKQIAEVLNGQVEGDPNVAIKDLSKIEEGKPGTLSFLANPIYTQFIYQTNASIVIVSKDFVAEKKIKSTLIRVDNAYSAFAQLLDIYNQINLNKTGISKHAFISKSAVIGKNVYIGEFVFVGENVIIGNNVKIYPQVYLGDNVKVDNDTTLFPGVIVYSDCIVGKECNIHAGVVIGGDGFGFAPEEENNYRKVAQIGNVIIKDNVEIGSATTIDRATLGSTIIGKGVKLDNQIQIAHNVEIGKNTVICSQCGVSGSTMIGENCMIGGQVGFVGHITIADNVKIAAQSGIGSSIKKEGTIVMGSPSFDITDYRKSYVYFRMLPKLVKRIEELEKELKKLKV